MRVMTDTNILFSALLFPESKPAKALFHVTKHQNLILCDYIICELKSVVLRKRPDLLSHIDEFLAKLSYSGIGNETSQNHVSLRVSGWCKIRNYFPHPPTKKPAGFPAGFTLPRCVGCYASSDAMRPHPRLVSGFSSMHHNSPGTPLR